MRIGSERRRAGFTLVELTIAVFMLGTVLAIATPYFVRSYNAAQLSSTARSLTTACQLARLQAVLRQRPAELHLDFARQNAWVQQALPSATDVDRVTVLHTVALSDRVALVSAQLADEPARKEGEVVIRFYPSGTSDAATVVVQRADGREALAVMVDPVIGRARVNSLK